MKSFCFAAAITLGMTSIAMAQGYYEPAPQPSSIGPRLAVAQLPAVPGFDLGTPAPLTASPQPLPYAQAPAPIPEAYALPAAPPPVSYNPAVSYSPAVLSNVAPLLPCPAEPYANVRVINPQKIPLCAVPKLIQVPDPCNKCVCVNVQVCVPQCDNPQRVRVTRHGNRVVLDYGRYEVVITSLRNVVLVHYRGIAV